MPLHNYSGKAFVAFVDISGFKKMMKQGDKAMRCLNDFYQIGYDIFRERRNEPLEGLFVSDCVILIGKTGNSEHTVDENEVKVLSELLGLVKQLNVKMAHKGWTLTTSIAYGDYAYEEKFELSNLEKTPIYGGAYVKAFLDSELEKKLKQGECRIVLDDDYSSQLENIIETLPDNLKNLIVKRGRDNKHRYFYWQLSDVNDIEKYEAEYKMSDEAVYDKRTEIIKKYTELITP